MSTCEEIPWPGKDSLTVTWSYWPGMENLLFNEKTAGIGVNNYIGTFESWIALLALKSRIESCPNSVILGLLLETERD